jgi:hypothetical protein
MNSTIIECSRFDAVDATSNSTWKNNLPTGGITINDGDMISIKNCFINSNTSDAENIEIPETINLQLTVGYYDINYSPTLTTAGANAVDYDYYIAYNNVVGSVADLTGLSFSLLYSSQPIDNYLSCEVTFTDNTGKSYDLIWFGFDDKKTNQPAVPIPSPPAGSQHSVVQVPLNYTGIVVSSLKVNLDKNDYFTGASWQGFGQGATALNTGFVSVKIPSGEYTRAGLAKHITDALQLSPPNYKNTVAEINNDMMRRTDLSFNHLGFQNGTATGVGDSNKTILLSENYADIGAVNATGLDFGTNVQIEFTTLDASNLPIERKTVSATVESLANGGIVPGPGGWSVKFTADIFTTLDKYAMGLVIINLPNDNIVFKRIGFDPLDPATKNYTYNAPAYYGSSENVLEYDEDRSVFLWQYLHMPYYGSAPPTICIRQLRNGTAGNAEAVNKYYTVTQLGGVFFLDIQPRDFIESLGFTADQLLVPIQPSGIILRDDLDNRITKGYSSLASMIDITNPKNITANTAQDIATTDTVGILASSLDDLTSGGFYLVDINLGAQNYLFQNGVKNNIQAIVSKYNQIKNYVTGYSDSSVGYVHQGAPFNLQTLSINILDPQTKLPDENIAGKTSIFIQITKNPQQLALPSTKDK